LREASSTLGWPPGSQDVTDALIWLREQGLVPWGWIEDETRTLTVWRYAETVAEFLLDTVDKAGINPRDAAPPLILTESRATAGVLKYAVAADHICPIAGTAGQVGGFLQVEIAPLLAEEDRRVLCLGDLDRSDNDIEANTRSVLERASGRSIDWQRLGMTEEQATERDNPYLSTLADYVEALGGHIEINAVFDDDVVSLGPVEKDRSELPA
jgi:hypothetical protein